MKTLYKSKTFWIAALQALAGIVLVFSTAYPQVGSLVILKSLLDVIIRFETTTSLIPQNVDNTTVEQG